MEDLELRELDQLSMGKTHLTSFQWDMKRQCLNAIIAMMSCFMMTQEYVSKNANVLCGVYVVENGIFRGHFAGYLCWLHYC
jgi:hypothetical protein